MEPKPCPFCGARPQLIRESQFAANLLRTFGLKKSLDLGGPGDGWMLECGGDDCPMLGLFCGPAPTPAALYELWNRRVV